MFGQGEIIKNTKVAFTLVNFAHDFALSLHILLKKYFFITKRANLVQNCPQNCANVKAPLVKFVGKTVSGIVPPNSQVSNQSTFLGFQG